MAQLKIRFFCRRERWVLTAQGWLLMLTFLLVLLTGIFSNIHGFLAVSAPIRADVLIVEGWLEDSNLKTALSEFKTQNYRYLITTGVTLPNGYYLTDYKSFAELSAATLRAVGFDSNQLVAVPAENVKRDRTYTSALAVKSWIDRTHPEIKAVNLYTSGVHARRSWLLYQKAFNSKIRVGIISADDPEYDHDDWWKSSAGVRKVMSEIIAYVYVQLFNRVN
jgi:hypothetical protein